MPIDTYNLKYIAAALGLRSTTAARKRVFSIRDILDKRGFLKYDAQHNNALAITLDGVNLLQRANDFGGSMAENAEMLRIELGDIQPPPDAEELRQFKHEMAEWKSHHRDEHKDLDRRLKALEKLTWWKRLLGRSNSIAPPAE